jgi:hypothetical protein
MGVRDKRISELANLIKLLRNFADVFKEESE